MHNGFFHGLKNVSDKKVQEVALNLTNLVFHSLIASCLEGPIITLHLDKTFQLAHCCDLPDSVSTFFKGHSLDTKIRCLQKRF
jgi:hypothetical protein